MNGQYWSMLLAFIKNPNHTNNIQKFWTSAVSLLRHSIFPCIQNNSTLKVAIVKFFKD